jgi:hypothetical protein
MLKWKVSENEGDTLPCVEEEQARPDPRRSVRLLLLLLLLLVGAAGGGLWWARQQEQQQETALHRDLMGAIEAEARALAARDVAQAMALLDPEVPTLWQVRYLNERYLIERIRQPDALGIPALLSVNLDDAGTLATVEVGWPDPRGDGEGAEPAREVVERRAYRLLDGSWRRTPLHLEGLAREERRTEHTVLIAPPADLALLADDPALRVDFEALWQHLETHWPRDGLIEPPLYIEVDPQEFDFLVPSATSRTVRVNSPHLVLRQLTDSDSPLSAKAQYRLLLTEYIMWLVSANWYAGLPETVASDFNTLSGALRAAEARRWTLTEEERATLRNQWREVLGRERCSPLDGDFLGRGLTQLTQGECRNASLQLLLEHIADTEEPGVFGRLAAEMATAEPGTADVITVFERATGRSREELEARAREYAATVEE